MNQRCTNDHFKLFSDILHSELVSASGCTEPASIAYCSAKISELLECTPTSIDVACSANIIKNVKSVVIPNSGNQLGIEAAAILGALIGDSKMGLEIFTKVNDSMIGKVDSLLRSNMCTVGLLDSDDPLHIRITGFCGDHHAIVELKHTHTNIVYLELDGTVVLDERNTEFEAQEKNVGESSLDIERIIHFAEQVDIVRYGLNTLLQKQIDENTAIAQEGAEKAYGSNIGRMLLDTYGNSVEIRARAYAAAGSDARMSGCEMPVVVNSGSGNQGLTVSIPVVQYAEELGVDEETMKRAMIISNLVAIHIKSQYARLSSFCGVVSAAAGSGAAITWLYGGSLEQIGETINNTLANISGMVCDGAKASCAAKISTSVDAAILAHGMSMMNRSFRPRCGIVGNDVETTVKNVGIMVNDGMKDLDRTILNILLD